jgi:hypothetical protein
MISFNDLMFEEAINEFNKLYGIDVRKDKELYERIKANCINIKANHFDNLSEKAKDNTRKMALSLTDELFDTRLKNNEEFIKILKECGDKKERLLNNKELKRIIDNELEKRNNTNKEENLQDSLVQGNNYFIKVKNEDGSSSPLIIEKTSVNSFKKVNGKKIKHYEVISDTLFNYFTTLYKGIEELKKNNENVEPKDKIPEDIIKKILNSYMKDDDPKFKGLYQDIVKDFSNNNKNEPLSKKLKNISKIFDKHFDTNLSEDKKLMNEMEELRNKIYENGGIANITNNKELLQKTKELRDKIFKTKKG